jgi:hypothetical protein
MVTRPLNGLYYTIIDEIKTSKAGYAEFSSVRHNAEGPTTLIRQKGEARKTAKWQHDGANGAWRS